MSSCSSRAPDGWPCDRACACRRDSGALSSGAATRRALWGANATVTWQRSSAACTCGVVDTCDATNFAGSFNVPCTARPIPRND
eukprot:363879-Chlamydomonas_euryale.AAC.12